MDMSQLASKMLEWETRKRELDVLTTEIEGVVLQIKQTQTVGNVRATYSQGRKAYDYREAVEKAGVPEDILERFTSSVIDYRSVCANEKLADVPFTQGEPSVTVKLLPYREV